MMYRHFVSETKAYHYPCGFDVAKHELLFIASSFGALGAPLSRDNTG